MKAIILAAGKGSRLLPYTLDKPKALVRINNTTLLEWQLWHFMCCGINEFIIVAGFRHRDIAHVLAQFKRSHPQINYELLYNQHYATSENIISCYQALSYHQDECILANGDVLFSSSLVETLCSSSVANINLLYGTKTEYDEDDMKIRKEGSYLTHISKTIEPALIDGESIGMILLTTQGAMLLLQEITAQLCIPEHEQKWYLYAINSLAQKEKIALVLTPNRRWCEVDYPQDLVIAKKLTKGWHSPHRALCRS